MLRSAYSPQVVEQQEEKRMNIGFGGGSVGSGVDSGGGCVSTSPTQNPEGSGQLETGDG